MQGTIAQTLALTIHGNAALRGREAGEFFPSNSTCIFCKSVRFVTVERSWLKRSEALFAATPQEWFERLAAAGVQGLQVSWGSLNHPWLLDRMSVGLVGGGGNWRIETSSDERSEAWLGRWEVGQRDDPEQRIWKVTYSRVAAAARRPDGPPRSLAGLSGDLRQLLAEAAGFARRLKLDSFAECFDRGIACLESAKPLADVYHRDLAPPGFLTLEAERLLAAAQASWVFGGMGSWNDIGFEKANEGAYESLSERLYSLLNQAAIEAANTSRDAASARRR